MFSCDRIIRANSKKRFESAKKLLPFVTVDIGNPLFSNSRDLEEFMDELYEGPPHERQTFLFDYLSFMSNNICNKIQYPCYSKLLWTKINHSKYNKGKHVYSPKPWGYEEDNSIVLQNINVSGTYGVKVPSRQYRRIRASRTLKALVG
tara:strand:+ start:455 stop:898 length:444 start_codon:yes stop_codon:yes gene_type:complete